MASLLFNNSGGALCDRCKAHEPLSWAAEEHGSATGSKRCVWENKLCYSLNSSS